jgi:hypothetical protein
MTRDIASILMLIVCLLVWLWFLGNITIKALEWWSSRNRNTPSWLNLGILLHQIGGLTGRDAIHGDLWRAGCAVAGIDHADGDGGHDVALIILPADCHLTEGQQAAIVWEATADADH